jgi:hypothetical protein
MFLDAVLLNIIEVTQRTFARSRGSASSMCPKSSATDAEGAVDSSVADSSDLAFADQAKLAHRTG